MPLRRVAGGGDIVALVDYDADAHEEALWALWTAYLEEGAVRLKEEAGFEHDVPAVVAADLASIGQFRPPVGRLLLAVDGGEALGCGAVRVLSPGVAEIKRMYLRPEARGRGIGRALLDELLATARRFGCREARLHTGWFMTDAHRLYRAAGFEDCEPYAGSEVPADFDPRWKYMRLDLAPESPTTWRSWSSVCDASCARPEPTLRLDNDASVTLTWCRTAMRS